MYKYAQYGNMKNVVIVRKIRLIKLFRVKTSYIYISDNGSQQFTTQIPTRFGINLKKNSKLLSEC